jgi:hypothetical protein
MKPTLNDVFFILYHETSNLDPRRKLTRRFTETRNYFQTHPTLLENMIHQSRLHPLAQLFFHGCKQNTDPDYLRLLGSAVHADSNTIRGQQHIIQYIQSSYIYEIGEMETVKHRKFDAERGTFAFDLEDIWPSIVVTDTDHVSQEADVIFQTVQEMSQGLSPELTDLFWWNLSPWLACVIAVCCASQLLIDPCYTSIIDNVDRIISGDFRMEKELAHHPLARIYFGC